MELSDFMRSYNPDAKSNYLRQLEEKGAYDHPLDEIAAVLEQKARLFGFVVKNATSLADQTRGLSEAQIEALPEAPEFVELNEQLPLMEEYFAWHSHQAGSINRDLGTWRTSKDKSIAWRAEVLTSRHMGHYLNADAESQWFNFVYSGSFARPPWREAQLQNSNVLAIHGAALVQDREQTLRKAGSTRTDYLKGDGAITNPNVVEGALNEIDAGIALLETALSPRGGWYVLPAPPQFEYLADNLNVDYLVLDLVGGRGLGVQVKGSGLRESENGQDHPEFIYLSGRYDLGNSVALPIQEDGQRPAYTTYSYAGAMALSALKRMNPKDPLIKNLTNHPTRRWAYGFALQKGNPTRLANAAERVRYKIDAKL